MGRLISVLQRAKTLTQHIVILYTHCLSCLLFCLRFFVFVLYRVHKLCSFSYLLISDVNVEGYQILVILTLLFVHGISEFPS